MQETFLRANANVFILCFLFMVTLGVVLFAYLKGVNDLATWSTNLAGQILAAILALLTASRAAMRKSDNSEFRPSVESNGTTTETTRNS